MLAGMVTEHRVGLLEARDTLGTIVMAAAYGNGRYVIERYGKTVAAVVGIAELMALRSRCKAQGASAQAHDAPGLDFHSPGGPEWICPRSDAQRRATGS